MFKGSLYYFHLCWKIEKGFPIALVFQAVLNAVKTIMLVVLPKYIIDALFVRQDEQQAVRFLALYISFFFASACYIHYVPASSVYGKILLFSVFKWSLERNLCR